MSSGNEPQLSNSISGREPRLSQLYTNVVYSMPAKSYNEAYCWLKMGKYKDETTDRPYPHGQSTRVQLTQTGIAIRYHDTDVVLYTPESIILNSGGYRIATTKSRINDALRVLPGRVVLYQNKGIWYITSGKSWDDPNKITVVYYDGIEVDYNGNLIEVDSEQTIKEQQRIERIQAQIKVYVREVKRQITDKTLPKPQPGDCWLCSLAHYDCLESHLEETYIHGMLIYNAVNEYSSLFAKQALQRFWYSPDNLTQWEHDYLVREIPGYVRRYFKVHCAIAR